MNQMPRPGEKYRHFKNKLYQIVAVATHSETGEKLVVYQALYGVFGVWARPLSMFLEPVDREKYPEAAQERRFERVEDAAGAGVEEEGAGSMGHAASAAEQNAGNRAAADESALDPLLFRFLDAESPRERINLLKLMKGRVGQAEVDSLCTCLDARQTGGSVEQQIDDLIGHLQMQQRYHTSRLRRG